MDITGLSPLAILAAFSFGALSFLSPCVLPLVPGYLSMMSGYSAADVAEGSTSTRKMLRVTLLFVGGFTVVFVALGAGATTLGTVLLRNLSLFTTIAGWMIVVFGIFLAVTAVWTPSFMMPFMRDTRADVRPSRLGSWAPPIMGAAFGFGWTPCIGPTLGAILTLAASTETVGSGMVLLFVYSMGLGLPFVLTGIGMSKMVRVFGWFRRHLRPITVTSGVLLAGFGLLIVSGNLTDLSRWFQDRFTDTPLEFFWNI